MGVRHALFPMLTFGATPGRGCQVPDAVGHASGVIGLVAGPLSNPFCEWLTNATSDVIHALRASAIPPDPCAKRGPLCPSVLHVF
jgi:hypothetical protein